MAITFERKTIGILGGMGPEATVELFKRIVNGTPAKTDQDHLRIIIDNNPGIPDRTAAILEKGSDPLPALIRSARVLQQAGADFLVIPCNTAHYWLPKLRKSLTIPVLDMVEEVVEEIAKYSQPLKRVGLMATTGTIKTKLYQTRLAEKGIRTLLPEPREQEQVMQSIFRVKGGDHRVEQQVLDVAQSLLDRGAQGMIMGCTELSVIGEGVGLACPLFDPLLILAQRAIDYAIRTGAS